jgi:hypothetical protein
VFNAFPNRKIGSYTRIQENMFKASKNESTINREIYPVFTAE